MALASRLAWIGGWWLIGTGVLAALAWIVSGDAWTGPVSWRKPLLFGLSTGVTLLSVSWVMARLRPRRFDPWLHGSLTLALVVEVALIDLQRVRGVASHFNRATPFDAAVTNGMEVLILLATLLLLDLTVRTFQRLPLPADQLWVARAGMLLLSVGCLLGVAIAVIGEAQLRSGQPPEIFGHQGVLKFPHGIPLHGIQIFQVQVAVLVALGVPLRRRVRSVAAAAAAVALATVYGVVQTGLGAPRLPPAGPAWVFAIATGISVLMAVVPLRNAFATVDAERLRR